MLADYKRSLFVRERQILGRRAGVAGHMGRACQGFVCVAQEEGFEGDAVGKADLCMAASLNRIANSCLNAGRLPIADRQMLRLAVWTIEPVIDGGLVQRYHQALFLGSPIWLLNKIPGLVEAMRRVVLVSGRNIEVRILSQC